MDTFERWWTNDLPIGVKIVCFLLLANAVPAITILMSLPGMTEDLFVWTVTPVINARLMGVMYANALILIAIGVLQTSWARVRIVKVVITLFSVLATELTFFFLKPFLAHPWYHLTYWLSMYLILFFAAPIVFVSQERKSGGRLPVQIPLNIGAQLFAALALTIALVVGLALIFRIDIVNQYWPWTLPPLVGGLIGVLFTTHAAAYAWSLWDDDWLRVRPMFWQAPITGLLFILLPLLHPSDLRPDAEEMLGLYYAVTGFLVLASLIVILGFRGAEKNLAHDR